MAIDQQLELQLLCVVVDLYQAIQPEMQLQRGMGIGHCVERAYLYARLEALEGATDTSYGVSVCGRTFRLLPKSGRATVRN